MTLTDKEMDEANTIPVSMASRALRSAADEYNKVVKRLARAEALLRSAAFYLEIYGRDTMAPITAKSCQRVHGEIGAFLHDSEVPHGR